MHHTLEEHKAAADKVGFKYKVIPVRVDEKTRDYFTPECYQENKGKFIGYIFKLTK